VEGDRQMGIAEPRFGGVCKVTKLGRY